MTSKQKDTLEWGKQKQNQAKPSQAVCFLHCKENSVPIITTMLDPVAGRLGGVGGGWDSIYRTGRPAAVQASAVCEISVESGEAVNKGPEARPS